MQVSPEKLLCVKLNFWNEINFSYNFSKILKTFQIFIFKKFFQKISFKKIATETNLQCELYFLFLTKFLDVFFKYKIWIFYSKNLKSLNFLLSNKKKIGAECTIGIFSCLKKIVFFNTQIGVIFYLIKWQGLINKSKDIFCKHKPSFFLLNKSNYPFYFTLFRSFKEKKKTFPITHEKNNQKKKIFLSKKNTKKFFFLNTFSEFFFNKFFFEKKKMFSCQFLNKFYYFSFQNFKLANFFKYQFNFLKKNLDPVFFVFLENLFFEIHLNVFYNLENFLNWKNIFFFRLALSAYKINDFFTNFTNFILAVDCMPFFYSNFLEKIQTSVPCTHEPVIFTTRKNYREWIIHVFLLIKKFKRFYFSEINTAFYLILFENFVSNSTYDEKLLTSDIRGSCKTETPYRFYMIKTYVDLKCRLSLKKHIGLEVGKSDLYLNV